MVACKLNRTCRRFHKKKLRELFSVSSHFINHKH